MKTQTSIRNGVLYLTLNSPQNYNALSLDMMTALQESLISGSKNSSVKAIVLKGEGKGFCAGHDLKEINAHQEESFYKKMMKVCCELMISIQNIPQPVIAQIHGVAAAAGCQLAASCDLAISSSDSRFSTPGVLIGLFCTTPMVAVTRAISRKHAFEMLFTGDMVSAQRAHEIGLINQHVPFEKLEFTVRELAEKIAEKSSYVVSIGKKAFYQQIEMSTKNAYDFASDVMLKNLLADDAKEGISSFLGKRKPVWRGR